MLQSGILAAENGDREKARSVFLKIVEDDPYNEDAWMWLCDLVDGLEDRIIALENVLTVNPYNNNARTLLETLKLAQEEQPDLADRKVPNVFSAVSAQPREKKDRKEESYNLLAQSASPTQPVKDRKVIEAKVHSQIMSVKRALINEDRNSAYGILLQMVEEDENTEIAWILLGCISPTQEDQKIALENILTLNPDNINAQQRLDLLNNAMTNELEKNLWVESDQIQSIIDNYLNGHQQKMALQQVKIQKTVAPAPDQTSKPHHENFASLLQHALWPVLIFLFLFIIKVFLIKTGFSGWFFPGVISIILGNLLINVRKMNPRPEFWIEYFGEPGDPMERSASWVSGGLGWILEAVPFLILILNLISPYLPS